MSWRAVARPAIAVLVLGAALTTWAHLQHDSILASRMLRAAPDEISAHADLERFALSRGEPAFRSHCASCHGLDGQPDPLRGVPDLRDQDWLYGHGRIDEIEKVILYGIRAGYSKGWDLASMPAFGTVHPYARYPTPALTPQEIQDVTEYLYSLQHPPGDPSAVEHGRKVFYGQSQGLCWDCHGDHGQGDPSIGAPNLTDAIWLYGDGSLRSIRASIAYGHSGACPGWIGRLSFVTIRSLAVYTRSLSRPEAGNSTMQTTHD